MFRVMSADSRSEAMTVGNAAAFLFPVAVSIYVGGLAYAYYFHRWGIARHHLETAWIWLVAVALAYALSKRPTSASTTIGAVQRVQPWVVCGFVLAAAVLYLPALSIGFLSDDFVLARLAARNDFLGTSWEFLRPLPVLCFKLAGAHPVALHAAIVVLHGVNAALVTVLATTAGQSAATPVVAGALFLTFPGHPEAVVWCSGLQDVLMTTGVLTAVVLANASREQLALPALAGALLSKETAVAAPALLWLFNPRRWRVALCGVGVVVVYAVWRLIALPPAPGYTSAPSSYKLKELLVRPFAALTVPVRTSMVTEWPWLGTALVCALLVLFLRAAWVWRGRRHEIWAASALALSVLVSVAPVYSLFDVSPTLQGARYLYLPAAAWSILVAALLMATNSRLNLVLAAAIVMTSAAGVRANLMPWSTAARVRDDLLANIDRARQAGCTAVWVRNVPDSVDGAYVFRNGLADAIAPVVLTQSAAPSCTVPGP
jgi:hypothetical protein